MKLIALILLIAGTHVCHASKIVTAFDVARIDYDLAAFENPNDPSSFSFRVYVAPAFPDGGYVIEGLLKVPKIGEAQGALTLTEKHRNEVTSRRFILTEIQSREAYRWFQDAKLLEQTVAESVDTLVLGGVEILIEGYNCGRYFHLRRNSGDSQSSAALFRNIEIFRIWKNEK